MRSSDWSSDVCSSDLVAGHRHLPGDGVAQRYVLNRFVLAEDNLGCCPEGPDDAIDLRFLIIDELDAWVRRSATRDLNRMGSRKGCKRDENRSDQCFHRRSEEHTSELQSLMRNSYAGF